ncbi:MAG: glycosyltransferase [Candidatus Brocadiales bacterium]
MRKKTCSERSESNNQQTISLCMIVKDEERNLSQCLESVKDVVDEMVILDTGSSDATVKIANEYRAMVLHRPWNGNFGDMRNYALKHTTGDWILQLDADERLVQEDMQFVKEAVEDKDVNSIFCKIVNIKGLPIGHTQFYSQRLFRNRLGAFYEGAVHETLRIKGRALFSSDIRIIHHGYNLDEAQMVVKSKRNASILERQIMENPHDIRSYLHLSKCYFAQGLYDLTIFAGKKVIENIDTETIRINPEIEIFMIMAFAYVRKHNFDAAEWMCQCAIEIDHDYIDPVFFMGKLLHDTKRYEKAIAWLKRYKELKEELKKKPRFDFRETYFIDTVQDVHLTLGSCYLEVGKFDEAEKEFLNTIEQNPEFAEAYNGLAVALGMQERHNEALINCIKAIDLKPGYKDAQENLRLIRNKLKMRGTIKI